MIDQTFSISRVPALSAGGMARTPNKRPKVKDGLEMRMSGQTNTEKVRIYKELCKGVEGCGICLSVCRLKLFKPSPMLNRKGYRPPEMTDPESCTSCENCMIFCPDLAIAVAEKRRKRPVKK